MTSDWLTALLPLLNAAGFPLLGVAAILLVRAYRHSAEAYERTSNALRSENDRLRERLTATDTLYFSEVDRMKSISAAAIAAIQELQIRKVAMLSKSQPELEDQVLSDVERINEAMESAREIARWAKDADRRLRETLLYVDEHFQELIAKVGSLADRIGDTKSRLALVGIAISPEVLDEARRATADVERGLVVESVRDELKDVLDRLAQLPAAPSDDPAG